MTIIIARPSRNLVFKANLAFIRHGLSLGRHGFQQKLRFLKRILAFILSFVHANNSLWICHGSVTYMSRTIPSRLLPILTVTDVGRHEFYQPPCQCTCKRFGNFLVKIKAILSKSKTYLQLRKFKDLLQAYMASSPVVFLPQEFQLAIKGDTSSHINGQHGLTRALQYVMNMD